MKFTIENKEFNREEFPNDLVWVEFTQIAEGDLLVHVGLYNDEHGENMTMLRLMQAWGELTKMILDNGKRLGLPNLSEQFKKAIDHIENDKGQVEVVDFPDTPVLLEKDDSTSIEGD